MALPMDAGHSRDMRPATQLRRNLAHRRVAGVAAGLSDFFGIDVTLIRVLFILSVFFTGGVGPLIYLVCWAVLPVGGSPASSSARTPRIGLLGIGIAILIVGSMLSFHDSSSWFIGLVVIAIVIAIFRKVRGRRSWRTRREFDKARLAWQKRMDEQASQAAPDTNLGGNPFQIGSFYAQTPPGYQPPTSGNPAQSPGYPLSPNPPETTNPDLGNPTSGNPSSGFQIQ